MAAMRRVEAAPQKADAAQVFHSPGLALPHGEASDFARAHVRPESAQVERNAVTRTWFPEDAKNCATETRFVSFLVQSTLKTA